MYIFYVLSFIASYAFMEFVAWSNHKYVMHGFLSAWHKDHHVNDLKRIEDKHPEKGLEKNDLFFLIYAIPAIVLMMFGISRSNYFMVSIAAGITLYGLTYFIIHDVVYHQRIKIKFLQNIKNKYFKALLKAHLAHHKPKNAKDFECYGLLIFPKRYFKN